jgi:hypothetical protein
MLVPGQVSYPLNKKHNFIHIMSCRYKPSNAEMVLEHGINIIWLARITEMPATISPVRRTPNPVKIHQAEI